MDGGAGGLPDLLDLDALLPDDRPTLAAGHEQVQVQVQLIIIISRSPSRFPKKWFLIVFMRCFSSPVVPEFPLFKYLADQCVSLRQNILLIKKYLRIYHLEHGVSWAINGDDPLLRAGALNPDLRT